MTPPFLSPIGLGLALACSLIGAGCGAFEPAPEEVVTALPDVVPEPADNVMSPEKVALGRWLFWDPILSGERDIACATCHHPRFAYADGIALSVGTGGRGLGPQRSPATTAPHRTRRNSMTVLDTAWNGVTALDSPGDADGAPMFWDSRLKSLEEQALRPLLEQDEMRGDVLAEDAILPEVIGRLSAIPEYESSFALAFGPGPSPITEESIGRAIAAFERTLVARDSSFDRFMAGDEAALSFAQKRGLFAFEQAGCANCHSGPLFSDFELHRLGVPDLDGLPQDAGDGDERFRTPSLRNVMRTAPYMHNGRFETIRDVVDGFYFHVDHGLDPDLEGLDCPNDRDGATLGDIEAFLWSISDGSFDDAVPSAVPSGLEVGGRLD
jgi:cytochrome c peroxidase